MQNFTTGFIKPMLDQGGIYLPAGDGRTGLIDTRDIAAVAVASFSNSQHQNQAYNLTGSEATTYAEAADLLSQALGRPITYVNMPEEAFRQALADAQWYPEQIDFMAGLLAVVRQGWAATITPDVAQILGRPPITLAQFVQDNLAIWQ